MTSSQWFGGWPNALQGVVSAVISGIIAAGAAYLVVGLTYKRSRQLAAEVEGRDAARILIGRSHDFLDALLTTNNSDRRSAFLRWLQAMEVYTPAIIAVDPCTKGRFPASTLMVGKMIDLIGSSDEAERSTAGKAVVGVVTELNSFLSEWVTEQSQVKTRATLQRRRAARRRRVADR